MRNWCLIAAMGCAAMIGITPAQAQYYRWGYGPPMRPHYYVYPHAYGWRYDYEPPPYEPPPYDPAPYEPAPRPYVRRPVLAVPYHRRGVERPTERHRTAHHLHTSITHRRLINPLLGPLPDH